MNTTVVLVAISVVLVGSLGAWRFIRVMQLDSAATRSRRSQVQKATAGVLEQLNAK